MVDVFGNDIINAYTGGVPVQSIYCYGELVWPSEPEPSNYYYSWTPTNASGWITSNGTTYKSISSYGGYLDLGSVSKPTYYFDSSTVISYNTNITFFSTNVISVPSHLLVDCSKIKSVVMNKCEYIGNAAFRGCQSLSSLIVPKCKNVGSYAFYNCNIWDLYIPNCTYIGSSAFCSFNTHNAFGSLYLPVCSYIGSYAFNGCVIDVSISLPICSYIGSYAFGGCNFSSISLPSCSNLRQGVFYHCSLLKSVRLPICTRIQSSAFQFDYNLTYISIPSCSVIESEAFNGCTSLSTISLPKCEAIGSSAFMSCAFRTITLPKCYVIGFEAFKDCSALSSITLKYSSVCKLKETTTSTGRYTFSGTKITSSTGYIYVPSSLVTSYKNADGWTYFKNRIFPIP